MNEHITPEQRAHLERIFDRSPIESDEGYRELGELVDDESDE